MARKSFTQRQMGFDARDTETPDKKHQKRARFQNAIFHRALLGHLSKSSLGLDGVLCLFRDCCFSVAEHDGPTDELSQVTVGQSKKQANKLGKIYKTGKVCCAGKGTVSYTHKHAVEGKLAMNFKLVGGCDTFACVKEHV